jgi:hypothetical protein
VRWAADKNAPTEFAVNSYLSRLRSDAHKAKVAFDSEIQADAEQIGYRYAGANHGVGTMFRPEGQGRSFFLEAAGPTKSCLEPTLRKAERSFSAGAEAVELWSLLGLQIRLPNGLTLERHELKAGKTALWLHARGVEICGQRWGLAEQLLRSKALEDWTAAVCGFHTPVVQSVDETSAFLLQPRLLSPPEEALAKVQSEHNQIVVISVRTRSEFWKPKWDWLV